MSQNHKSLGLPSLTALVVGAMIGSGIFSIPQNIAKHAGPAAALIGWGITAIGMLSLAFVFIDIHKKQPHLTAGVYSYAKEGFGNLFGFSSAWGYWLSATLGNVSYIIVIFSTLGYYLPDLLGTSGNSGLAIILASVLLWTMHIIILMGVKEAAWLNVITTVSKIVPIIAFITICLIFFNMKNFMFDFSFAVKGSLFTQVKGMMIVTVWVFIGIEGANLFAGRAKLSSDVAKSTSLGFFIVLACLVLVNMLSYGIMTPEELAGLPDTSTAYILEKAVGHWGAVLMTVGLLISVLGALLAWILFSAEILFQAAKDKSFPKMLTRENNKYVPSYSLFLSNFIVQIFLIITFFNKETYDSLFYLSTSMILLPYFFSAAFGFKYTIQNKFSIKDLCLYGLAVIYSSWLIYAAGLKYLLLSSILYVSGLPLYLKANIENKVPSFKGYEKVVVSLLFIFAFYASYRQVFSFFSWIFSYL